MKKKSPRIQKISLILTVLAISVGVLRKSSASIVKAIWEVKDPAIENSETISKTAARYGLNKASVVTVAPAEFPGILNNFHHGIPEALIFDKAGRYIEYKANDSACNAGIFGFIPTLNSLGDYKRTGKTTLLKTMAPLRDLNGAPLPKNFIDTTADFYIFISWTVFAGKLNRDHVYKWQELVAKNKMAKIQVVEVNMDVQRWWPDAAQDSILKTCWH